MKSLMGVVLALGFLAGPTMAQQVADTGKVNIEANELEFEGGGDKAIFRGNVVAARDGTTILCQTMIVNYIISKAADGTEKREVGAIDAVGGATIKTANETITADKATIIDSQNKLLASGNVKLMQGKTVMRGGNLTINLKTRKVDMKGGRVRLSTEP